MLQPMNFAAPINSIRERVEGVDGSRPRECWLLEVYRADRRAVARVGFPERKQPLASVLASAATWWHSGRSVTRSRRHRASSRATRHDALEKRDRRVPFACVHV